jgi:hypothetical protein
MYACLDVRGYPDVDKCTYTRTPYNETSAIFIDSSLDNVWKSTCIQLAEETHPFALQQLASACS